MMYEGSLCVCCMSTDDLVQLFGCELENGEDENYAKILAACLNVKLSEDDGHDSICKPCVTILKDCVGFKKQVLNSLSILSSIDLKDLINKEEMEVLFRSSSKTLVLETIEPISVTVEQRHIDNIEVQISPCSTSWVWDDEYEHLPKLQTASSRKPITAVPSEVQSAVLVKEKLSRRGRPRIHPPDEKMPYDISPDELECRECGEVFCNNVTLKVHYNKHFGQLKCTVCNKIFITQGSFSKHQRSHLKGPFKCCHCDQVFRSINSLNSHKRIKHSLILPYRCTVKDCDERFATISRRLQHLDEKHLILEYNYPCKYCSRKFRTSSERAKHTSSRHEVRYFRCAVCGARCRLAARTAHMRAHAHGRTGARAGREGSGGGGGERRFVCKLCSQEFGQKRSLVYHIGSHVRRGDYHGDPAFLIHDKRDQKQNHGLLSEDNQEEHSDEFILSDKYDDNDFGNVDNDRDDDVDGDIADSIGINISDSIDINVIDNIDIDDLEIDFLDDSFQKLDNGDVHEICTDLAFSTPEYFE